MVYFLLRLHIFVFGLPIRPLISGIRQSWTLSSLKSPPTSWNLRTQMALTCCPKSETAPGRKALGNGRPSQLWNTARLSHWSVRWTLA